MLLAVTIGMGVLIVAGVAVLASVLVQRGLAGSGAPSVVSLHEPPGTRIAATTAAGPDRIVLQLNGGGAPDRVVVVDLKTGRITATIGLAP